MVNGRKGIRRVLVLGTMALPLMLGCPQGGGHREFSDADNVTNTDPHDHHHEHGPNGGHILELGEYHGEIAITDGRVLTLFVLGEDAKTPVPVADATAKVLLKVGEETKEIPLEAAPLEGETDGKTSRFTAAADALPAEIVDIEGVNGEVVLIVAGKEHKASASHDHHHDHAH